MRQFSFWKDEPASRLEGDDSLDVLVLDRGQPAWPAALRMRHQDARADLGEERGHAIGNQVCIERADVRRHRAEILVEGLRLAVELDAVEVVRPNAHSELAEPELLVGRRLDRRLDRAAPGITAPRLVDEIGRVTPAQEDVLEALAPVRRRLPGLRELPKTVPHDHRVFPRVHWQLVERVEMIAVEGLTIWLERFERIERARRGNDCSTHHEAALVLHDQRLGLRRGLGSRWSRGQQARGKKRRQQDVFTVDQRHRSLTTSSSHGEPSLLPNPRLDSLIH